MRRLFKPLRVLLAIACFTGVNAAFLAPTVVSAFMLPGESRFAAICRWQVWPALVSVDLVVVGALLALTALLGRVYCSTLCPLGVFQDVAIRLRRIFRRPQGAHETPWNRTRYTVLAVCAAAVAAGFMAVPALVEPYSAYGRMASQLARPALQWAINLFAAWSDAHEYYWALSDEVVVAGFLAFWAAVATFIVVGALAVWRGRWFCNAVCPVGTLLSLAAKRPLMRLRIDESRCVGCGVCERGCKAHCIDVKARRIDNSRCVRCFNCLGACRKGAVKL